MITINYQAFGNKGFLLRLRLYQEGETKFINVTKLLKGTIREKHWNQKRCLFQMSVKPLVSLFFKKRREAVSTSVFLKQDCFNIRTAVL